MLPLPIHEPSAIAAMTVVRPAGSLSRSLAKTRTMAPNTQETCRALHHCGGWPIVAERSSPNDVGLQLLEKQQGNCPVTS